VIRGSFYLRTPSAHRYALSIQNEPDMADNYQSCLWTPQQIHDFVPYLQSALLLSRRLTPPKCGREQPENEPLPKPSLVSLSITISSFGLQNRQSGHRSALSELVRPWPGDFAQTPGGRGLEFF
jgi:hypothetical protein